MNCPRDIFGSSFAPSVLGLPSAYGLKTASATRIRGSFCPINGGAANGRHAPTARVFTPSIPCASSIACTPFQRTISNGF